ncbi:hypothetical protein B0H13DRAFT_2269490 [Mycena leptocephala]|nr:hypothetical protein B0H13DRAFT_2269490 [Mycena leptocephala]
MSNASLPTGCSASDFLGPTDPGTARPTFSGCIVGVPSILETCCTKVGSTAVFVNGTCGCPYPFNIASGSPAAQEDAVQVFFNCTSEAEPGMTSVIVMCGHATASAARASHELGSVRWNLAVLMLGVAVITGAMGV